MANKGIAAFDEFISGVLSKITDPDQKRKAEETVGALKQIPSVTQALGDGVAGQSEIDRELQRLTALQADIDARKADIDTRDAGLTTYHEQLTGWFNTNKELLDDGKKFRASGGKVLKPGDPGYVAPHADGLTADQFKESINGERAAFLGFQRDQNLITREHFTRFGEIVNLEPLFQHPKIAEVGLIGVYELVHKDRLDAFKTAEQKKHDDDVALKAVTEYAAKQATMPYPSVTGAGSGSPLDALTAGQKEPLVDAASAHYNRLQLERAGVGAKA